MLHTRSTLCSYAAILYVVGVGVIPHIYISTWYMYMTYCISSYTYSILYIFYLYTIDRSMHIHKRTKTEPKFI